MHNHQTGVNMTYLTMNVLTPSLQFMVLNNWYTNQPTYFLILHHELIFTNQPNLVVDSCNHPSLQPNCYRQIIHCKINLQVEYPPTYQRHVWNYAKANEKRMVPSAIWEIFSEFLIFCNLFYEPLGKWNNSKIWEKRKIFANITRDNVR